MYIKLPTHSLNVTLQFSYKISLKLETLSIECTFISICFKIHLIPNFLGL